MVWQKALFGLTCRRYSTSALHPLVQSEVKYMLAKNTRTTTLNNGIRVATHQAPGHFASVGVYVDAGSKYETDKTSGFSHLMDRLAFKSTMDFTSDKLVAQVESMGGNVMSHASRESIMYQTAVFHEDVPNVVSLLASIVQRPLFLKEELDEVRTSTAYELQDVIFRPDMTLPELLHQVAYKTPEGAVNTLGRPLLCSMDTLQSVTSEELMEYRNMWYTPDRLVVAAVGVDHDAFVSLVNQHFGDMKPISNELKLKRQESMASIQYSGGIHLVDSKTLPESPNPDDIPLTHIHIAFESLSMNDPDIYALATLASLLGGGGSFSAGGPGKGMYTRLYTEVLNRYHWVENCNTINFSYVDTGLFGISASIPPMDASHKYMVPVICDQLVLTTQIIRDEELHRAKNQLKSSLLMSLESKMVELEDIGRQVMIHGHRLDVQEMCRRIDSLSAQDLKRAARRVLLGSDEPSPLDFKDPHAKHWKRTGKGEATVVIQGPLSPRDPLLQVEKTLADWKIGKHTSGRKKFWGF